MDLATGESVGNPRRLRRLRAVLRLSADEQQEFGYLYNGGGLMEDRVAKTFIAGFLLVVAVDIVGLVGFIIINLWLTSSWLFLGVLGSLAALVYVSWHLAPIIDKHIG